MPGIYVWALDKGADPSKRIEPVDHHTILEVRVVSDTNVGFCYRKSTV
jgi:hypothetical protein